ncbi:MAG: Holliday junction branch migration protein RuvA [Lachnospiraceae bacterium]|nr:Holliday junction branch migration protein RuvA [Lachnospiraceae bacterium]
MIRYIKGTLEMIEEDAVVLDNHGIGYRILVSPAMLDSLPDMGSEMRIYTYLNVREDAMQLFGFGSMDELEIFKMLITVSGIGPKAGLSILGTLSADDIRFAVLADDAAAIAKAPGVGAKTAKKVIVELKDKIAAKETVDAVLEKAVTGTVDKERKQQGVSKSSAEAVEALSALGYSAAEALKAVKQIENAEALTTEELLKQVLKLM